MRPGQARGTLNGGGRPLSSRRYPGVAAFTSGRARYRQPCMLSAAIQLSAGPDPEANLAAGISAVRAAAAAGARLVVLPEKWVAYGDPDLQASAARTLEEWTALLGPLAAELGIDLVAGSVSERQTGDDSRLRNLSLHFGPDGAVQAAYRKIHPFDADVAGRRYRESDDERPGDELVVAPLVDPAFMLGLTICFDVRFGELFGALAAGGANVIALPAAFTEKTTRDHWETLVRARAIETGAYVIAANQFGEHPGGSRTGGRSLIVSPWGDVLARGSDDHAEVLLADLEPDAVAQAREALPVLQLRRPDVYQRAPVAPRDRAALSD